MKIQKKNFFFWGGEGGGGSGRRGMFRGGGGHRAQGGCEQRIEVFVKIKKKAGVRGGEGGVGLGVRVDVNEELKFL